MFTAFTAPLEHGPMSLRAFALRCARAIDVAAHLRDETLDAPIPEVIQPDGRSAAAARAAREELALVEAWDEAAAQREADAFNESSRDAEERHLAETASVRARYEALRAEVETWKAPTLEHETLKRYMLDQLTRDWPNVEFPRVDGPTCKADRIEYLRDLIAFHERHHRVEVEGAAKATAWFATLRASLPEEPEAVAEAPAQVAAPAVSPEKPTVLRCTACGCLLRVNADGTHSLCDASRKPGACCDNATNPPLVAAFDLDAFRALYRTMDHGPECSIGADKNPECDCGHLAVGQLLREVERMQESAQRTLAEVELLRADIVSLEEGVGKLERAFGVAGNVAATKGALPATEQDLRTALRSAIQECNRQRREAATFVALAARWGNRLGLTREEVLKELHEVADKQCKIAPSAAAETAKVHPGPKGLKRCTACGCLWRVNADDTLSLRDATQKSCAACDNAPSPPYEDVVIDERGVAQ
jgi:hypothetical protein